MRRHTPGPAHTAIANDATDATDAATLLIFPLRKSPLRKSIVPLALAACLAACGGGGTATTSAADGTTGTDVTTPTDVVLAEDKPLVDAVIYSGKPEGQITLDQAKEEVAVTHHSINLNGVAMPYTVTAGHLTTVDTGDSSARASMFYVAYTKDLKEGEVPGSRPVTFLYNGGPGSSATWIMLGGYAPKRINTDGFPAAMPPAPFTLEDNPDTLLDKTDLVYINPVGTGYSAAIAPRKNTEFWSSDTDADSIRDFVQRYLSINRRWNSPKYLMGESYGGPRSAVASWRLQMAGIPLNGITLLAPLLDFTQRGNLYGLLPTMAMGARYQKVSAPSFQALTVDQAAQAARDFTSTEYKAFTDSLEYPLTGTAGDVLRSARRSEDLDRQFPDKYNAFLPKIQSLLGTGFGDESAWAYSYSDADPSFRDTINTRIRLGSTEAMLKKQYARALSLSAQTQFFHKTILADRKLQTGAYDMRVLATTQGIAETIPAASGGNDPSIVAVNGAYTALWRDYVAGELKYTNNSTFVGLNLDVFANWNFTHTRPDGLITRGADAMDTRPDLAATLTLNPYMKVVALLGYYDMVTPFYQTEIDLDTLPMLAALKKNISIHHYESGHMLYLDNKARTDSRKDLEALYTGAVTPDPLADRGSRRIPAAATAH